MPHSRMPHPPQRLKNSGPAPRRAPPSEVQGSLPLPKMFPPGSAPCQAGGKSAGFGGKSALRKSDLISEEEKSILENIPMDTKDEAVALVLRSLRNNGKFEDLREIL